MAELDDKDLHAMFQRTGHLHPANDLAARIMARVAVTPIARRTEVKPLIGRWGWVAIAVAALIAVAAVLLGGGASAGQPGPVSGVLQRAVQLIELPGGQWPLWLAGTAACALLLALMDRLLASRIGDRSMG
jgi:hypothetical protein